MTKNEQERILDSVCFHCILLRNICNGLCWTDRLTKKNCDCGHSKNEHMLTQKSMSVLDVILFHDRVATLQEGRGECRICHCSKYEPPKKLNPRWGMDYSLRPVKKSTEERCTRCGRLFKNHENINHHFQYSDRTPV